jgi:hypothetical protein
MFRFLKPYKAVANKLMRLLEYEEPGSPHALLKALSQAATAKSAQIVQRDMPEALIFLEQKRFLKYCLDQAPTAGEHCEFGVYGGYTINLLGGFRPSVTFHGFDSFEGLPEAWTGHGDFDFGRGGEMPAVCSNVTLHKGWFSETLPPFAKTVETVAFLHVDCDLYSSTVCIFDNLGDKLAPGAVIVFDEYFCYPSFEMHEYKAFAEYLQRSGHSAKWIAVCGQRAACILQMGS